MARCSFKVLSDEFAPEALSSDIDWHQVAGKHFTRASSHLHCMEEKVARGIFMVVDEPRRIVSSHLMSIGHKNFINLFQGEDPPPMAALATQDRSIIWAVLSYYTMLLQGRSERIYFILAIRGISNRLEWYNSFPHNVVLLRRFIGSTSGGLWRRLHHLLTGVYPWPLIAIGSKLPVSVVDPDARARQFIRKRTCCLPCGLAEQCHSTYSDPAFTEDENVKRLVDQHTFFRLLACKTLPSAAATERAHALDSIYTTAKHPITIEQLNARSMIHNVRENHEFHVQSFNAQVVGADAIAKETVRSGADDRVFLRKHQAEQIDWYDFCKENSFKGRGGCVTSEARLAGRQAWVNLSAEQRAFYIKEAELSGGAAAHGRAQLALLAPSHCQAIRDREAG